MSKTIQRKIITLGVAGMLIFSGLPVQVFAGEVQEVNADVVGKLTDEEDQKATGSAVIVEEKEETTTEDTDKTVSEVMNDLYWRLAFISAEQSEVGTKEEAKAAVEKIIEGADFKGVNVEIVDVVYADAVEGTEDNWAGEEGYYEFHVELSKGESHDRFGGRLPIRAISYDQTEQGKADADVDAVIEEVRTATKSLKVEQGEVTNKEQGKAIVENVLQGMNLRGVKVEVVGDDYTAPVAGNVRNPEGTGGFYRYSLEFTKGTKCQCLGGSYVYISPAIYDGPQEAPDTYKTVSEVKENIKGKLSAVYALQSEAGTEEEAKAVVEKRLEGIDLKGVKVEIIRKSYTAAVEETECNGSGQSGYYGYNVELTKGESKDSFKGYVYIAATPYSETEQGRADADVEAVTKEVRELADNLRFIEKELTTKEEARAAAEKAIQGIDLRGVTVKVIDDYYVEPTAGTRNNPKGKIGTYNYIVEFTKGTKCKSYAGNCLYINPAPYEEAEDTELTVSEVSKAVKLRLGCVHAKQSETGTKEAARAVVDKILAGIDLKGVKVEIIETSYVEAVEGTEDNWNGRDGYYAYDVNMTKGTDSDIFHGDLYIKGTPYNETEQGRADADVDAVADEVKAATNNLRVNQSEVNTEEAAVAFIEKAIEGIDLRGVKVAIVGGRYREAIAGTVDNPKGSSGSYSYAIEFTKGTRCQCAASNYLYVRPTAYEAAN